MSRTGTLALLVVLAFIALAVLAPWVAPFPDQGLGAPNIAEKFQPPGSLHWLGTDHLGRDVMSRVLFGGQVSLRVGFVAVVIGLGIGIIVGVLSGYVGGYLDMALQRVVDILMAVPNILLALTIVASFGAGIWNVTFAIAIGIAPRAEIGRAHV